jgi:hypothetical protein
VDATHLMFTNLYVHIFSLNTVNIYFMSILFYIFAQSTAIISRTFSSTKISVSLSRSLCCSCSHSPQLCEVQCEAYQSCENTHQYVLGIYFNHHCTSQFLQEKNICKNKSVCEGRERVLCNYFKRLKVYRIFTPVRRAIISKKTMLAKLFINTVPNLVISTALLLVNLRIYNT